MKREVREGIPIMDERATPIILKVFANAFSILERLSYKTNLSDFTIYHKTKGD